MGWKQAGEVIRFSRAPAGDMFAEAGLGAELSERHYRLRVFRRNIIQAVNSSSAS